MKGLVSVLMALALLLPQGSRGAAGAMPEAPNCPIYPGDDVWHSSIRLNLRPVIDSTVWLEDQGVFWLIVVP